MDDIQDLLEDNEEIQDALSRSYDVGEAFDEDELEGGQKLFKDFFFLL
jgi:hypothetical protein